jgi:hypothetical protein
MIAPDTFRQVEAIHPPWNMGIGHEGPRGRIPFDGAQGCVSIGRLDHPEARLSDPIRQDPPFIGILLDEDHRRIAALT